MCSQEVHLSSRLCLTQDCQCDFRSTHRAATDGSACTLPAQLLATQTSGSRRQEATGLDSSLSPMLEMPTTSAEFLSTVQLELDAFSPATHTRLCLSLSPGHPIEHVTVSQSLMSWVWPPCSGGLCLPNQSLSSPLTLNNSFPWKDQHPSCAGPIPWPLSNWHRPHHLHLLSVLQPTGAHTNLHCATAGHQPKWLPVEGILPGILTQARSFPVLDNPADAEGIIL